MGPRGRLVEVKSEKDNAWTEQRIWIRSLTEPGFINYDNPYLFDGERAPVVDISICKVRDQREAGGEAEEGGGGVDVKQPIGTDADFADDQAKPAAKRKAKAKDEGRRRSAARQPRRRRRSANARRRRRRRQPGRQEPVLVDSDSDDDAKKRGGAKRKASCRRRPSTTRATISLTLREQATCVMGAMNYDCTCQSPVASDHAPFSAHARPRAAAAARCRARRSGRPAG